MNRFYSILSKPVELLLRCYHQMYENLFVHPILDTDPGIKTQVAVNEYDREDLLSDFDDNVESIDDININDFLDDCDGDGLTPQKKSDSVMSISIDELDLPVRLYNCFMRANIKSVGEIAEHSQKWLVQNIRNLGRRGTEEVARKLTELGIYLPELTEEEEAEEVRLKQSTEDAAEDVQSKLSALEALNGMIGLALVKERMKDLTAHCAIRKLKCEVFGGSKSVVPNMIFLGNPGTGKTTVANLVAKAFREMGFMKSGQIVRVTRTDLVAEYTGQSAAKTTKVFESALDGVLFIDEAYSLYHKTEYGRAGDTLSIEAIDTLTDLMTEYAGRCCVILAGYSDEMNFMLENANPGLRERFPFKLDFEDYSSPELRKIFLLKASEQKLNIPDDCEKILTDTMDHICENKSRLFANGRVVENYLQEVILRQERRLFDRQRDGIELSETDLLMLSYDDFLHATKSMINGAPAKPIKRPIGFAVADTAA